MFKKLGVVTVGIAAGLAVGAPLASAGEAGHDHGKKSTTITDDSQTCTFTGGDAIALSDLTVAETEGAGIPAVEQSPTGGSNSGNLGNCSDVTILNDVLNDNLNNNFNGAFSPSTSTSISILGDGSDLGGVTD